MAQVDSPRAAAAVPSEPPDLVGVDVLGRAHESQASEKRGHRSGSRGRRALIYGVVVLALAAGAAVAGAWWFVIRETDDDRYLAAVEAGGFSSNFANPEVALAAGRAFCDELASGSTTEGFDYQKPAVDELCPEFADAVEVIPTPEQQAEQLASELREAGLGGKFPSDAAAVARAKSLCQDLDDGAAQQGVREDAIAVGVYCQQYADGFKTLYPIEVKGTFDLSDDDPSYYFPSMDGSARNCYGSGGYNDISEGTEVLVKNSAGDVLTTTVLGPGTGVPPYMCTFKFRFTVMDGEEGGYFLEVSHRGQQHYTAAQLKVPGSVALFLG